MSESNIVRYDGVCPICGSQDGMVIKGADGKYRNICRVMGCPAMYRSAPFAGFDSPDEAVNPWETALVKSEITVGEYITGKREDDDHGD